MVWRTEYQIRQILGGTRNEVWQRLKTSKIKRFGNLEKTYNDRNKSDKILLVESPSNRLIGLNIIRKCFSSGRKLYIYIYAGDKYHCRSSEYFHPNEIDIIVIEI